MKTKHNSKDIMRIEIPKYILIIVCVIAVFVFASIQPKFLKGDNIMSLLTTASISGIMAFAAMLPFACGEVNFAVSSSASLAATIAGLYAGTSIGYIPALLFGIACGTVVGLLTSFLSFKLRIPSLIASLGVAKLFDGLVEKLADNKTILSNSWPESFTFLGQGKILGISAALFTLLILSIIMIIVTDKTRFGRHIFAIGANKAACKQSGINLTLTKTLTFIVSSALAGLSGIMLSSQVGQVTLLSGNSLMMNAIAAAMLGATCIRPGRFSIQGTLVAILLMSILQNGVICIGAPTQWKTLIQGIVFIFAVGFISMTRKGGLPAVSMT